MKTYEMTVSITFVAELLGTLPNNAQIYEDFILGKANKAAMAAYGRDELAAIQRKKALESDLAAEAADTLEKGTTIFPRDENGNPGTYNYQWEGYFKSVCSYLKKVEGTLSAKLTAFKKVIDGMIFVKDRFNPILVPPQGWMEDENGNHSLFICERPLRAQTAQGERVSLARSEVICPGAMTTITVVAFTKEHIKLVREWLEYGIFHGTGQWRNSGKGRFICEFGAVKEGELDYPEYVERYKRALADNEYLTTWQAAMAAQEAEAAGEDPNAAMKKTIAAGRKKARAAKVADGE